ncbi:hypothetical protein [Pseudogemmobacter sonorensis]|uniref:hypothetical protein n=1 Tax=Pseudogemmobacter sonorensis TaxID=2989681 RepID=UPI00368C19AE
MIGNNIVPAGSVGTADQDISSYDPSNALFEVPESDPEAEAQGALENAGFWKAQIEAALTSERRWRQEALNAENLYFGPDQDPGVTSSDEAPKMNLITDDVSFIHANIDVLKPLVFSETPTPIVTRRWRGDGRSDETDLMAAEAGQRIAQWILSTTCFDQTMERARDDWLIAGRGVARALYKAEFGEQPVVDPTTGAPMIDPATGIPVSETVKTSEEVIPKAWEWRRALFCPGHSFESTPWIAFETPMTRSRIAKRFPDHVNDFAFTTPGLAGQGRAPGDDERDTGRMGSTLDRTGEISLNPFAVATVWEIWVKEERRIVFWSPDCPGVILEKQDDPLELEHFWPMPKPLLSTTRGDNLTPRPDISYYAERAREIDKATRKMKELLETLAVAGLFPAAETDTFKQLFSGKNQLIPVQSWISLMEKGGTANMIQWLPLEQIMNCLNALSMMREASKQAMFEHSGVSDIMRAQGDPKETATAQQLKGRYAGMRLSVRQRHMAVFARDMLRIMVEIMLEMFDTARLAEICGLDLPISEAERHMRLMQIEQARMVFAQEMQAYQALQAIAQQAQQAGQQVGPLPPPPQEPKFDRVPETSWEMVHNRLRDDFSRKITLTIETDSTILADEQADKEARIEFLGAFSTFVQQLMPLMGSGQFDMKTVKELLLFGIRSFPKSRTLEGMINQLPEEPQGPPREETQVTVAKIRAETDKLLKEMEMADADKERAHEVRLKGVDLIADAADKGTDPRRRGERPKPPEAERQAVAAV